MVKNSAVAINPIDWQKQVLGDVLLGYIKYPFILGGDVAGTVIEVGAGVRRFQVGDRVVGAALAIAESCNKPAQGGFQLYTVVPEHMATPLPSHVSEEAACVVPLTLCTAAYGLFHDDFLALDPPKVPARPTAPDTDGKSRAVIITGGSTSVGANAIQLAVAAGYEVSSTASPKEPRHGQTPGGLARVRLPQQDAGRRLARRRPRPHVGRGLGDRRRRRRRVHRRTQGPPGTDE